MVAQALASMQVFQSYPGTAVHILDRGIFGYGHQSMELADNIFAVLLDAGFDQRSALKIDTTCFCFIAGLVDTNVEAPNDLSAQEFPAIGMPSPDAFDGLETGGHRTLGPTMPTRRCHRLTRPGVNRATPPPCSPSSPSSSPIDPRSSLRRP